VYDGLAIDTGRHKLYLADAAQSGGKVAEMSTDGTGYRVLISDINSQPRGLVLHNENRYCTNICIVFDVYQVLFNDWVTGWTFGLQNFVPAISKVLRWEIFGRPDLTRSDLRKIGRLNKNRK